MCELADIVNDGLLPAGVRWREWDFPVAMGAVPKVPFAELPARMAEFAGRVAARRDGDRFALAAWVEWELNYGTLHPFYDGCGRISRAYAACWLMAADIPLPVHGSADDYAVAAMEGVGEFVEYYRSRIG